MWKSLDTEGTGLDLHHSARPFFVTFCDEEFNIKYFEWDVDPLTRMPIVPDEDLYEIEEEIQSAEKLVLQNPKYDVSALNTLSETNGWQWEEFDWSKVLDTLLAGHLLASNQPHDLTTMALVELRVNIKPYEEKLKQAVNEARRYCRSHYPEWKIAKRGLEGMPSAKEAVWQYDMWLPKAVAKHEGYLTGKCEIVNLKTDKFDIRIDRSTKWGNPFHIGKDGTREQVIEKYRKSLLSNKELMVALSELDGKRLGCFCKPLDCHGDILQEELAKLAHPWWTVLSDYSNADSSVTLPLLKKQLAKIEARGLTKIYNERLKLLPIVYDMESRGITGNKERAWELHAGYTITSKASESVCINLSEGKLETLPVNGASNALREVVFEHFNLIPCKETAKGAPSLDKQVLDEWLDTLPKQSKPYLFVKHLRAYRRRKTAMSYIESYNDYWLSEDKDNPEDPWFRMYPSLNPTGTSTLRWSSQNPNEQQISKQDIEEITDTGDLEKHNARYMFGPLPGEEWWSCDAQNIERRIPAYEANEELIIKLLEKPDESPYYGSEHALVAHIIFPEEFEACGNGKVFKEKYKATLYQWTKNFNFALQYGCQEEKGDATAHVKGAYQKVKSRFNKQEKLNQHWIRFADKHGYVETMPDKTVDPSRGYPLMCTRTKWGKISPTIPLSYHVQGTATWWIMKAMIRLQEFLTELNRSNVLFKQFMKRNKTANETRIGYHMALQVHDELVIKTPKGQGKEPWRTNRPILQEVQRLMSLGGDDIGVPTPVACAYHKDNWGEEITI